MKIIKHIFQFGFVFFGLASCARSHSPDYKIAANGVHAEAGFFSEPHVFLTLCAKAGVIDGNYQDTMFELNWSYFTDIKAGDWVGLFNYSISPGDVSKDHSALALSSIQVPSANETGYFKTEIRFGRPDITSVSEGDNCLGYWISYLNSSNFPIKTNCFRKYPRWMNELKQEIGNVPLHALMIPGTHDAGAIREYDGLASENLAVRYSVNQEERLYRQFIHGIRYIDMRVAHYPNTPEKFWINHGDARFAPLITLFEAVRRFVEETKEIIFMDFHGFPVGMGNISTHNQLLEFVQEQLGSHLVHKSHIGTNFKNVTPNQLWNLNRTVILTYQRDDISSQHDFLWPYLIHAWGDVNLVKPLEEYFDQVALPEYGCKGIFWSAMAEMTPKVSDSILYPLRGLRGFAQMVNIPLTYWWHRPEWYSRSMIISTDFFLGNNIIEMSVLANKNKLVCPAEDSELTTTSHAEAKEAFAMIPLFIASFLISLSF